MLQLAENTTRARQKSHVKGRRSDVTMTPFVVRL